jgi:hypothetical protein
VRSMGNLLPGSSTGGPASSLQRRNSSTNPSGGDQLGALGVPGNATLSEYRSA